MRLLGVVCVLCGLAFPAFALDREAFTFTKYDLEVRVEPDQQRLGVRGKVSVRNDSPVPQKNVVLQVSSTLAWRSIHVDGKMVEYVSQPYVSDVDHTGSLSEAIVALPRPVPPKGTVNLEIGYEGTIPLDATRLTRIGAPQEVARHTEWDQIGTSFTAVRGAGYVAWYPVAMESANLSEPSSESATLSRWQSRTEATNFHVNLCEVEHGGKFQTAVMNEPARLSVPGGSAGGVSNGEGWTCGEHSFSPVGKTVPAFAMAPYAVLSKESLDVNYLLEHKPAADDYALAVDLAAPFVSEWFGPSRKEATLLELADPKASPHESGRVLFTPLNQDSDSRVAQLTAVHQLTHAAFESSRPWIYEGLAHFAQAAYREQQNGRQAAFDFMNLHRPSIADAEKSLLSEKSPSSSTDQSLINTSIEEFYRSKAMYVWWMLRDMVGEAALKRALAAYKVDQDKGPSYVQHLIEAQSKRDLEWFFDDWVYRDRGLPDFRVQLAYARQIMVSGYLVTVTVENLGEAGAEVPVTLHFQGGDVARRIEVRGKSKTVIRMEAASTPLEVVVNDGSVPESDVSNNSFKPQMGNH